MIVFVTITPVTESSGSHDETVSDAIRPDGSIRELVAVYINTDILAAT